MLHFYKINTLALSQQHLNKTTTTQTDSRLDRQQTATTENQQEN
jgi:hypothetical protein